MNPRYGVVKTKRKTRPPERRKQVTTSEDENSVVSMIAPMHEDKKAVPEPTPQLVSDQATD